MTRNKNIALFFDGTWNRPRENGGTDANTNVRKLFLAAEKDSDRQLARYICGVGASDDVVNKAVGGVGGWGVSKNICIGYEHLVNHYRDEDHVYLFGFSRGAYTARSLAGFIRCVGLLLENHIDRVPEAFMLYKSNARVEDSDLWPFLRQILGRQDLETTPVPVYLIGVWDTVGRLGIPGPLRVIPNPAVRFHRTDLPDNVTHGRQALALHELRPQFEPVLWTSYRSPQTLKQVWFAGAHCDVGGGYDDARLSDLALGWMADEAIHPDGASPHGLIVDRSELPLAPDPLWRVQHELKKWFALVPSRIRSAIAERPVLAAETIEVHESARRRCWDASRAAYRAWRPDVKCQLRTVDELTLQLDLWLLYERPEPTPEKCWWESLRCKDISEIVECTRALVAAGPLKDGTSGKLEIRNGEPLGRSLCSLFLFAEKQPLRELIDAYDKRFIEVYSELVSLKGNKAMLNAQAQAWKSLTVAFDAALAEACELLPAACVGAYNGTVWPPDEGLTARGALRFSIDKLTGRS